MMNNNLKMEADILLAQYHKAHDNLDADTADLAMFATLRHAVAMGGENEEFALHILRMLGDPEEDKSKPPIDEDKKMDILADLIIGSLFSI